MPSTLMLRLIGVAVVALALYGMYWSVYQQGYDAHVTKAKLAQAESDKKAAEKLRKLEGDKNANMAEVNRLRANNHALWLRLPKSIAGCTGSDTTAGDGQLPESAPSSAEQALNEFANQCGEQAYRCDSIVESCRVLNDSLQ